MLTKSHNRLLKVSERLKLHIQIPNLILPEIKGEQLESDSDSDLADEEIIDNSKMPQGKIDILRLCAQTINKNYSGDPIGLNAFLNSITLLEDVTEAENIETLKNVILTKLEGKALEAVPERPATILIITEALKDKIKPDNSKIIEARILSLRNDNISSQDFSKRAEDLSDALKRALIVEGISQDKANEMAVDKTVEMCRANTRSNLVKSVLASSTFKDSKSVIAKFLVESNNNVKENQVLNFKSYANPNKFYSDSSNNYSNSNKNFNRYRNSSSPDPQRFEGKQSYQSGRRPFNGRFQSNFNDKSFRKYDRGANIRVIESENSETPQSLNLGELDAQND